jgi:hypothetical protein
LMSWPFTVVTGPSKCPGGSFVAAGAEPSFMQYGFGRSFSS